MTSRMWTREELDRVHPLPEGWEWARELDNPLFARGPHGSSVSVCRESDSLVSVIYDSDGGHLHHFPPDTVALAVLLASRGLDSAEAMVADLSRRSGEARQHSSEGEGDSAYQEGLHTGYAPSRDGAAVTIAYTIGNEFANRFADRLVERVFGRDVEGTREDRARAAYDELYEGGDGGEPLGLDVWSWGSDTFAKAVEWYENRPSGGDTNGERLFSCVATFCTTAKARGWSQLGPSDRAAFERAAKRLILHRQ